MEGVAIAFVCDEGYVMQTAVAITSVIRNKAAESNYDIYIIGTGLSDSSVETFLSMRGRGVEISVIQAEIDAELYKQKNAESIYLVATKAALLKFEIPRILRREKVLYLDGDIIVMGDLSELFSVDLGDSYAAVVRDLPQVLFDVPLIDVGIGRDYFNSGVMLLNLKQLRVENVREKLVDEKRRRSNDTLMDQNVLNIVFKDRVLQLPMKYNVLYANLRRSWKEPGVVERLNQLYGTSYRAAQDLRRDAVVVHYSSKDKPWKYFDAPMAKQWMEVYRRSPYRDIPLRRKCLLMQRIRNKIKQVV